MARNTSTVYLGYEDECVTDKNKHLIDFTTNKVGGQPAWPSTDIPVSACPICGLRRPLVLQIYAPLEKSPFHRTLYVFSCVNADCSNQSKGWLCLRVQQMETITEGRPAAPAVAANINWCSGADDWGDSDSMFTVGAASGSEPFEEDLDNANDEPNGNVISKVDNRMSDEDEETNSLENDPIAAFGNLTVDDKNANVGAQGGAIGRLNLPNATAEIEEEDSELVMIDVPQAPKRDLIALLKQTNAVPMDQSKINLKSFFVSVDLERVSNTNGMADHIRELLQEYQGGHDENKTSPNSPGCGAVGGSGAVSGGESEEKYEKGIPIHGDVMFHNFLLNLQDNPSQIIRYTRDALPLIIAPLSEPKPKCQNCGGELLCEVQILPTIIPRLRFSSTGDAAPIEFGNVLVFTCQQSCWDTPDKMRIEHIVVQQEN